MDALRPLGIPLHVAIEEYVEARRHAGAGLIAAAKEHGRRHAIATVRKSIAERLKRSRGKAARRNERALSAIASKPSQSLRRTFPDEHQHGDIRANRGLVATNKARTAYTKTTFRLSIVTLFKLRKSARYLPKAVPTEADPWLRRKTAAAKSGYSLRRNSLIFLNAATKKRNFICDRSFHRLAIGRAHSSRMGGRKFRTRIYPGWKSESKNCDASLWSRFNRISKCGSRLTARRTVLIFVSEHAAIARSAQVKAAGIKWPNNVLRHSYATLRLAQMGQDASSGRARNGKLAANALSQLPRAIG